MDFGPDPADHDEVVQRFARRLFVLAYHLTGDSDKAGSLCQECLIRSLLAPDFPSTDREAGVFLHRGLISLWREREARPVRGVPVRLHREHAALWRALSRLDPVSRAVLVLRVAGGLEYETIGKVLDMAPDIVYARLLQARGGLREGERALETSLFESMNLYLDERLTVEQRGEFERRLQTDPVLREKVEFHRGLTLELHEEAPPLPRDFAGRLRERLEKSQETLALVDFAVEESTGSPAAPLTEGGGPAPLRRPRSSLLVATTVACLILAVGVTIGLRVARRRAPTAASPTGESQGGAAARPGGTPDEATLQALRSLGYLAPAKERAKGKSVKETQPSTAGGASAARSVGEGEPMAWSVVPVGRPPRSGSDLQVIRSALEWAMLFEGSGQAAPEVDFERDMAILLRVQPPGEPRGRLDVAGVRRTPEAILIECHAERPAAGAAPGTPGQAVVIPVSDLPVRVVVR